MDILFIIDQSGSMGGAAFGSPDNDEGSDPQGMRFQAPQTAFQLLNSYIQFDVNNVPTVNISLMAFGESNRLMLNWTEFDLNQPNWDQTLNQIIEDVSASRFVGTNLGYTDFLTAMQMAQSQFQTVPSPLLGETHLRAIIIVTDGAPCVPPQTGQYINCFNLAETGASAHIQQVGQNIDAFFDADSDTFIIALDADSQFWPAVEADWQNAICDVAPCNATNQAVNPATLASQMQDVLGLLWSKLNPNFNSQPIPHQDGLATFYVPPYTQSILVVISKNLPTPLQGITFTQPDGVLVNDNEADVDTLIQRHSVGGDQSVLPKPGTWQMFVPPSNDISIIRDMQIQLIQATIGAGFPFDTTPQQWLPTTLTSTIISSGVGGLKVARYRDANGNELYPLTVMVTVEDKNGNREILPMSVVSNAQDTHEYQVQWIPTTTLPYSFYLTASYVDDNGQTIYLFQNELMEFDANQDGSPDDTAVSPTGTTIAWEGLSTGSVPEGSSTALTVKFIDNATNQPITVDTSGFDVQVQVLDAVTNQPLRDPVILPNTATEPGVISTDILVESPGQYLLRGTLGDVDANGNFIPLIADGSISPAYNLEVRPVYEVELRLVSPTETKAPGLGPFPFSWRNAPIQITVEVFDSQNNLIDLDLITNGQVKTPSLTVTRDNNSKDLTMLLSRQSGGVYMVETESFGLGTYSFSTSLPDDNSLFVADYKWGTRLTDSRTQERYIPIFAWVEWIGIPLILIVIALVAWWLTSREVNSRENPLKGKLVVIRYNLADSTSQVVWEKDLTKLGKNFASFGGYADKDQLRARTNQVVRRLDVSTLNDPKYSANSQVVIENLQSQGLHADGKPDKTSTLIAGTILSPGARQTLWSGNVNGMQIEYVLEKDGGGETGAFDFESVVNDFSV
ncbi:MAG: vWA domain-containing protein [Phototrophicaceae bacterium]